MQVLVDKPRKTVEKTNYGQLKIFIGGSELNKWATSEQKNRAKSLIFDILTALKYDNSIIVPPVKFHETSVVDPSLKYIGKYKIVVLSGHCPVGEERYYCVDCNSWLLDGDTHLNITDFKHHRIIKTYDKGGVDSWVEIIATKLGIPVELHPPEVKQWNDEKYYCVACNTSFPTFRSFQRHLNKSICKTKPKIRKGYRSRNLDMAKEANIGYTIEAKGSCKYCKGTGEKVISKMPINSARFLRQESKNRFIVKCYYCNGTKARSGATFVISEMLALGKEAYKIVI